MPAAVEFLFDFVSPNAYLAYYPLKEIAAKHGAEIVITPVFLGGMHKLTGNAPPFIRDAGVKGKNAYAMLEMERFIARHGFDKFRMNPHFPFNSVQLQRMLVAAKDMGRAVEFIDFLLPQVWEQGADVTDPDAVTALLAASPFDPQDLLEKIQSPDVKQRLADSTAEAVERGAFGVPTFFVGGEMYFGKDRLAQLEEALAAG
ncbi:2-hydroxychromene-2-carboxylate isomerase [Allopontixanthobacter sediminis]|uniref:2-hydroxychromene-2-carboxylate isomerase n=1 Tax=Allopontixanthobacter sediminis TaxID=1689985 RepID=A0A845B492_9SPHN|nr:2-hydroxychromene-2-carboxylate isomerase [Allopontixanthobacter sediminis]MXP44237.1 2-hydroxychromene-2-carboxylate isomerase [Allopontixanthobacter sediminis]